MQQAHRRLGAIDVLAAGAARAIGIDANVAREARAIERVGRRALRRRWQGAPGMRYFAPTLRAGALG